MDHIDPPPPPKPPRMNKLSEAFICWGVAIMSRVAERLMLKLFLNATHYDVQ